jgi:hypothetical protein
MCKSMIAVGTTFLILTPPSYTVEHLFIVISIQTNTQEALLVNITSPSLGCDMSCNISVGEHSFLTYDSVINYADAIITKISILENSLKNEVIKKHDPVKADLLKKIQNGALNSPAIPLKCQAFLSTNM